MKLNFSKFGFDIDQASEKAISQNVEIQRVQILRARNKSTPRYSAFPQSCISSNINLAVCNPQHLNKVTQFRNDYLLETKLVALQNCFFFTNLTKKNGRMLILTMTKATKHIIQIISVRSVKDLPVIIKISKVAQLEYLRL